MSVYKQENAGQLPLSSSSQQIEYFTVASYKMTSSGVSHTLYHGQPLQTPQQPHLHQQQKHKFDLESINEISRTSTNSTLASVSSDIYLDPNHDYKLVLTFNKEEIDLVRTTWREMISDDISKSDKSQGSSGAGHSSIASSLFCIQFYSNLLAMDSNLEKLFPSIKHQAVSFAGVLSTAIHSLENLEGLDAYLSNLGKRHARILGIDPPHFELMGVALMKTFKDRFGEGFTLELERCWARLYTYLANSILQFGIDPVLKNDKINDEFNFVMSRTTTSTSTSSTQASSLFDNSRPMSFSSSASAVAAPSTLNQKRAVSTSSAAQLRTKNKQALPPVPTSASSKSKMSKGNRGFGKVKPSSIEDGAGDDEKCVIM
jgi:hemoglobin-like flavoprotein